MEHRHLHPCLEPVPSAARVDGGGRAEAWRPVPAYDGLYEVSNWGRVRSVERVEESQNGHGLFVRHRAATLRRLFYTNDRARVTLFRAGRAEKWQVCHLVLLAFVGPPPGEVGLHDGQFSCNHKDGDCRNDRVENLEWLTNEAHRRHTVGHRLHAARETHARAKLTWADVREIRRAHSAGEAGQTALAARFGVSKGNVDHIVKHKTWTEVAP